MDDDRGHENPGTEKRTLSWHSMSLTFISVFLIPQASQGQPRTSQVDAVHPVVCIMDEEF